MFLRVVRHLSVIVTFMLSVAVALLVFFLVEEITKFDESLSQFYAPTIYAVRSFAEASGNMEKSAAERGLPERIAVLHLKEATERLITLSGKWHPEFRQHMESMLQRALSLIGKVEEGHASGKDIFPEISRLHREAKEHEAMHEAELKVALQGIGEYALLTKSIAPLLLVLGILFSIREAQMQRRREREHEKLSAIKALAYALDARDPYTRGHSERVAEYAVAIGGQMKLGKDMLDRLTIAALMHDIGKLAVPDDILRKPGKLSDEEFAAIKEHPARSARFLSCFESLRDIASWVASHHERYDGKGYPEGRIGKEIPLPSRIIALADSFDAMTSSRPYRPAMGVEQAIGEIEKNKNFQWDIDVVDAFMRCYTQGAIGTAVHSREEKCNGLKISFQ